MPLSEQDLDVLQQSLLGLHQDRDLECFRAEGPGILLAALDAEYFLWLESAFSGLTNPLQKMVYWDHPARVRPAHIHDILDFVPEHPFTPHARKTGDFGPMLLSDFWTDEQLRASTIWRDVYCELGIGRMLVNTAFRGRRICVAHACRQLTAPDFSERDRILLRLLMPHYMLALHKAEQVSARRDGVERPLLTMGLTAREAEVATWLARGRTNPEIATILGMKQRTVEKHVERILIKLSVENRTAAAMMIAGQLSLDAQPTPEPEQAPEQAPAARRTRTVSRTRAPRRR